MIRRQRARYRWLRRLSLAAAGLVAIAVAVFGWAALSTDSSTIARAVLWMEADAGDQSRFPARRIRTGTTPSPLRSGREAELRLDDVLRGTDTSAFVVVHEDTLVYERYLGGSTGRTPETSFSVAKSFVSTLVGIAIEERRIRSVDDPITDYVPELARRDVRFRRITLRHLLTMSSGIRYSVPGLPWPWSDDTYTYYGVDLREVALRRSRIERPPGQDWHYNNYNPLLLGLVLERATGMSISDYTARKLWQPLGAESDASWSLDSESSGFEKLESGVNAIARDYARFGLLFLHRGRWNGRRIVSPAWVRGATTAQLATDHVSAYGYFWWVDTERPGNFYAFGNLGQYIYIAPAADAVVVRTGRGWGHGNRRWLEVFRDVTDRLRP